MLEIFLKSLYRNKSLKLDRSKMAFTLLEMLLTIAAVSIVIAVVIIAINPSRQFAQARNADRASDLRTIQTAVEQYYVDHKTVWPASIPQELIEICDENGNPAGTCLNLSGLVPDYLAAIPKDPSLAPGVEGTNYFIALNENSRTLAFSAPGSTEYDLPMINIGVIDPDTTVAMDENFPAGTGFNGGVTSITQQSDGKLLITGSFTEYNGQPAAGIIRLNLDGTIDTGFVTGTGFNGSPLKIAIQSDGKIVVVGSFTIYNGNTRNRIVRLNSNGSLDTGFSIGTGFGNLQYAVQIQSDGKIVVGGYRTTYNGAAVNGITRLNTNGSRDSTLHNTAASPMPIYTGVKIQPDGKIICIGSMQNFSSTPAVGIVRLNQAGTIDTSFNTSTGLNYGLAYSIFLQPEDGKILTGGAFTAYKGVTVNRVVRINPDASIDPSFNITHPFAKVSGTPTIWAINKIDDKILIGGSFDSYNNISANLIRTDINGNYDDTFNIGTGFNGTIMSITQQADGKLLVGGSFTEYNGQPAVGLIRFDY